MSLIFSPVYESFSLWNVLTSSHVCDTINIYYIIREEKNITQAKLSEDSGVNLQMIQKYEQGVKDINKAQGITLNKLAQALECTIEDILNLEETT